MSRRHRAARRLGAGSAVLARRCGGWLLPGHWRGTAVRLVVLVVAGRLGWALVESRPAVLWLLAGGWLLAAWTTTPPDVEPEPELVDYDADRAALLAWLDEVTDGRNGIHLAELYGRLRDRPALAHLDDAELRAMLDHYQIPVRRTLRVDGVAGRSGVARAAVEELLRDTSPADAVAPPRPPESDPDLRESPLSGALSGPTREGSGAPYTDLEEHIADALDLIHGEGVNTP